MLVGTVLYLSLSRSSPWTKIGDGVNCSLVMDSRRNLLYTIRDTSVWRCSYPDTSPTWEEIGEGLPEDNPGGTPHEVGHITCDEVHGILYASCQWDGVWRGDNLDTNPGWTPGIEGGRALSTTYDSRRNILYCDQWRFCIGRIFDPDTSPRSDPIEAINGRSFYSAGILGFDEVRNILYISVVFKSAGGVNYYRCHNPDSLPAFHRMQIAPDMDYAYGATYDALNNILYVVTDDGRIMRCRNPDTSPSWSKMGEWRSEYPVVTLVFDAASNTLYASTHEGILYCTDPGTSKEWHDLDVPSYKYYSSLVCDPRHHYLYLATDNGVWRTEGVSSQPSGD